MTESQVRQAIKKDFSILDSKISVTRNAGDLTTVVAAQVEDLYPGFGIAQVNYVFGYSLKTLAQVTVVWGGPVDQALKVESAIQLSSLLRDHLLAGGYKPDSIVVNTPVPTVKGQIVVFRGADADGHMTALVLTELPASPQSAPVLLQLAYIMDPRNPDIYKPQKGQF